jgi:serine/threonine protein kinase
LQLQELVWLKQDGELLGVLVPGEKFKMKNSIELSAFSLAKGKKLIGDDFYGYKLHDDLTIAIVCDGVGNAIKGREAAKSTVNYLINSLKNSPKSWDMQKNILYFIDNINQTLYQQSISEYEKVEFVTTLALVVIKGNRLYGANVGDSKIYLLRENKLLQLSVNHSLKDENSHILTAAIGLQKSVTPYYFENNLQIGDKIMLCSDGVYNELTKKELIEALSINASYTVKKVSKKYNDNLPDDATAIVLKINNIDEKIQLKNKNLIIKQNYKKGEVIDGYKLIKPLALHKRIWKCSKKGQFYVIKFAPKEAIEDEKSLDLFIQEIWHAKNIKAGFFVKAVVPNNRTHRYYIMQYIKGLNLEEKIKKKPISIDDSIELAKFLLNSAQFLISKNLVHADIKPQNIMIYKNRFNKKSFKLIDYGSITQNFSLINKAGTASYIAPERFNADPISEQSEIFAIGTVLYEVLTSKLPYGNIEPFQTPNFKTPKPPSKYNPKIPKWLDSIILKAIEVDTNKRYEHYSQMLYDINNPHKVLPYLNSEDFYEKNKTLVCKVAIVLSLLLNLAIILIK